MEDGDDRHPSAGLSVDQSNGELFGPAPSGRARSGSSASSTTTTGHRRSLSGTLFSKLSFLRMSQTTATQAAPSGGMDNGDTTSLGSSPRGGKAMATALQQQKRTRRRRGSLRKTALLGTRFEKRAAATPSPSSPRSVDVSSAGYRTDNTSGSGRSLTSSPTSPPDDEQTPRGSFDRDRTASSSPPASSPLSPSAQRATMNSVSRHQQNLSSVPGDETTTDDEDVVSFPRLNNNTSSIRNSSASSAGGGGGGGGGGGADGTSTGTSAAAGMHIPTPSSSSDSYFPPPPLHQPDSISSSASSRQHQHQQHPRPTHAHRPKSPLAAEMRTTASHQHQVEIWDYSETEWWGWIILMVTWIVFVVGMGSCFGVWSWAWDVGETPYAPPELEDDPTLPIVGYYPALIILTAVMSWVWVVVAWVGMKYFKHANISGEDI